MGKTVSFKIYAFIASVLLVLTAGMMNVPTAHADEEKTVDIENITIDQTTPLKQWDSFGVQWDWSAKNGVTAGQKFTIQFPKEIAVKGTFGIKLVDGAVEGGDCVVDGGNNQVVCTFNKEFEGKDNVHGMVKVQAQAIKTTDNSNEPTLPFEVNGKVVNVTLPGPHGGIGPADVKVPGETNKDGWFTSKDGSKIEWRIVMLGKDLANISGDVVINDSISLKNGAVGHKFIADGLLAVEYTSDPAQLAEPSSKGEKLQVTQNIAADGLSQKLTLKKPAGGWQADRFYNVYYQSQSADGKESAVDTTVGNNAKIEGLPAQNLVRNVTRKQSGSGTITGVNRGTFEVKKVHDPATQPAELQNGTKFTVNVDIQSPQASFNKNYDIQVPLNGDIVKGDVSLPKDTKVTLTEKLPTNDAKFTYGDPKFAATTASDGNVEIKDNGKTAVITISDQRNVGVTLTNKVTAKPQVGTVKLAKKLVWKNSGDAFTEANATAQTFKVNYVCTKDGKDVKSGEVTLKGDGTEAAIADVPLGAACSFTEVAPAALPGFNWEGNFFQTPSGEVSKNNPLVVAVTNPVVTLTNKYTTAVGTFKVVKKVQATGITVPSTKKFSFNYTCTKDGAALAEHTNKKLEVTGAGEVVSPNIPVGASCTVTEDRESAKIDGATLTVAESGPVTITAGTVPSVTIANTYVKDEGDFTITKRLVDPNGVATGKTFDFAYVCTAAGKPEIKGELKGVPAGGSKTSPKIPAGYSCKITETGASVANADLKTTGLNDVTIVKNSTQTVEATNAYSQWKGIVKLSKSLTGTGKELAKNKEFQVGYKCVKADKVTKEGKLTVKAGTPVEIKDVPVGSVCTFTEDKAQATVEGASFNELDSTTVATATVADKDATVAANLVNSYHELGAVAVTKAVQGTAAGSSDSKKEYTIIAEWQNNGKTETQEFKVKAGETYTGLPKLPVGTQITLKEKLPEGNVFSTWQTPGYTSDTKDAVKDNGDGTAIVTVQAGTGAKGTLVKVTNTTNIPWYWLLVPLIPLAGAAIPGAPAPQGGKPQGNAPQTPGVQAQGQAPSGAQKPGANPAQNVQSQQPNGQKQQVQGQKAQNKGLANTGASVLWAIAGALVLAVVGAVLVLRSRRRNND